MNLYVNQHSNLPIYQQIVNQIKHQILNKELKEGEILPSIRGLAKSLETSVITVKRAYLELSKSNYIETIAGKGTFVKSIDESTLNNEKLNLIKEKLEETVVTAKELNIPKEDLLKFIEEIYK